MSKTTRLILVDSNTRRRAAISHLFANSGIHVEPFEDTAEIERRWPRDGVLLVHDEGDAISRLIEHMGSSGDWLPLIGFAAGAGTRQAVRAVLAGAIDYLGWPFDEGEIAEVITDAEERADSLGNIKLREAMARSRIERLTRREREVLSGVVSGLSNRLIGQQLHISPRTVEIHRSNMLNKIGARHTSDAIRIAIEASFVS